jgi:hypothetical protein
MPFDIFCGHLVHPFFFWYIVSSKIWQPCDEFRKKANGKEKEKMRITKY